MTKTEDYVRKTNKISAALLSFIGDHFGDEDVLVLAMAATNIAAELTYETNCLAADPSRTEAELVDRFKGLAGMSMAAVQQRKKGQLS